MSSSARPARRTRQHDRPADRLGDHQPLEVVHALDAVAVDLDDQVLGLAARRARPGCRARPRRPRCPSAGRPARAAAAGSGAARRRCRGRRGARAPRSSAAPMIRRVAPLIGTASPSPTPATAVLTPTTRPRPSPSAPPELPGFSAASVWITLSTMRPAPRGPTGSERPSADTTPAVTDPAKPYGLPIATTSWPDAQLAPRRRARRPAGRRRARAAPPGPRAGRRRRPRTAARGRR